MNKIIHTQFWHLLKNNWIGCLIPKNAQTSIKKHRATGHRGSTPKLSERKIRESRKTFAVIRNPYDRLVSCWLNRQNDFPVKTFQDFLDLCIETEDEKLNHHARSQVWYLEPMPTVLIDFHDINEVLFDMGMPLDHDNKTYTRKPWPSYYQDGYIKPVRDRYREDFDIYEHKLWRKG